MQLAVNSEPTNLTFRSLDEREFPEGWFAHEKTDAAYRLGVDDNGARDGGRCARITAEDAAAGSFGAFSQRVDATSYVGKRVRFTASLRAEEGLAVLWARADARDGEVLEIRNTPATGTGWVTVSSILDVAEDASEIRFGFFLARDGTAWCDSIEIDVVGPIGEGDEPARALDARGLENLTAFARMLGYVRHFHPSDEAARADWDRFAIAGVQRVEGCASSQELARTLEELFLPVAPSARVFASAEVPPIEFGTSDRVLRWRHIGVDLGTGRNPYSPYSSERLDDDRLTADDHGTVSQVFEAAAFRSQRITLSLLCRTEADARASVVISARTEESEVMKRSSDPVASQGWSAVEVSFDVPETTDVIVLELRAEGDGASLFSRIACVSDGAEQPELTNLDLALDDVGRFPLGWMFEGAAAGYECKLVEDTGIRSIRIEGVARAVTHAPRLGDRTIVPLGGGVTCAVPLAVPADEGGTLPRAAAPVATPDKPEAFTPTGSDRATRLAAVVLAWNVFQHFYPYFDEVGCDWDQELPKALARAATDSDAHAFLSTLRRLVAALQDGHGNVHRGGGGHALPLFWQVVEEQLVVTASAAPGIVVGDVVVAINDTPAMEALRAVEQEKSGATVAWRRYVATWALLSATKPVRLEVIGADGVRRTESVAPAESEVPVAKPAKIEEVRPGTWYVDLDRISDKDFAAALPDLARASGIVFDLRGYPGNLSTVVLSHLIDHPIQCAQWRTPHLMRPDRVDMRFPEYGVWHVDPASPRLSARIAFCVGPQAISYAETYMGMVEHYKLGEIVGSPTAGTNGNVNPFVLPGDYRVVWTGMKVRKHDGSPHHGVGILPTVPVEQTIDGIRAGRDEVLEAALGIGSRADLGSP